MDKIVLQEDVNNEDVKILNPYEYFQSVKDRIQEMNDEKLELEIEKILNSFKE